MNTLILDRINDLQATSIANNVAKIRASLTLEDFTAKDIAAGLKEAGITGAKAATFANVYYDWLAAGERTDLEALDYIMGDGEFGETSANVMKSKAHYLNIHALTIRIWNAAI